jgi:glycosyltransferase involved in cell wall biosynthesis
LKESKPDLSIRYLIAGKGPFEPNLRDLVRELELEEQVEFLGFIAREDVNLLYSATDLFVMPSVYLKDSGSVEGFGSGLRRSGLMRNTIPWRDRRGRFRRHQRWRDRIYR